MSKKTKSNDCACSDDGRKSSQTCRVEAIVGIDERGQMVLPKELRARAGIKAGDKLALTSWERDGVVCCITLMKVENLIDMVKDQLGPLMKEVM